MIEDDRARALGIVRESLGMAPIPADALESLSVESRFVVCEDRIVQGALRVLPWHHFFGARPVRAVGVASVAVSPNARGRGLAHLLLRETLRGQREQGVALATLFFSSMSPYRRVGFELAGVRIRYQAALETLPARSELSVAAHDLADLEPIKRCYRSFAQTQNGLVDRPDWLWELVLDPPDTGPLYCYTVPGADGLRGYIVFAHEPVGNAHLPFDYAPGDGNIAMRLVARDLVWHDLDAARALLAFARGHRTWGTELMWTGPVDEPLSQLMPDREPVLAQRQSWMARVLDVETALSARGYPPTADHELTLEVLDDTLPTNNGAYRIAVTGGRATVERINAATVKITTGGLAAVSTGWLGPRDAARLGALHGASETDLTIMETIWAGPQPWMAESF